MSYDPHIHHRHSIRLKGYDYSQEGLYYITICVQDRVCLFGNVGAPLVGAQHNNGAQYNNDTQKNNDVQNDVNAQYDNGRPRRHAPTCAQYDNDAQKNNDVQNVDNAQNDDGRQMGRMDDNGQNGLFDINGRLDDNGRPQGHAPTCAQINNDIQNDDNAQNDDTQNNTNQYTNGIIQNDGGADDIMGRMDDDGQNGRPQGHAPTCVTTNATNAPIMILNDAGKMVETEWLKLTERFPNIELHEFVVMPNHFHGILQIVDTSSSGKTVGDMMDAFKSITTVEYVHGVKQSGWKPFDGKLWQRNYWEHIIRDDQSYQTISDYIIDNPAKWKADKFFNQ